VGLAKRQMEENEERGWSSAGDKYVCAKHVEDYALAELIAENVTSAPCTYCGGEGAAHIDVLIERIGSSLPEEWGNADEEGVAWDGGYVGKPYDTYELITEAGDPPLNHSELIGDVVRALPQQAWVQRDFYRLRPDLRLRHGWREFASTVKHHRRYFFSDHGRDTEDPDYIAPGALLDAIGDALRSGGLIRALPEKPIYRVRPHSSKERPRTAAELGAPPAEKIDKSSRMSPAGVPLFYGALDPDTAATEAHEANPDAEASTMGTFRARRAARVVDLSTPPKVPSLYDPDRRHLRHGLSFIRHFVSEIAKPFVRDKYIHIEYVPTQVVTERLRTRFDPGPGEPLVGVLYGSSRSAGAINLSLFIDNGGACDPENERDSALLVLTGHERLGG
jgi:HEPN/RES N-terminal domain 1/RES domain